MFNPNVLQIIWYNIIGYSRRQYEPDISIKAEILKPRRIRNRMFLKLAYFMKAVNVERDHEP